MTDTLRSKLRPFVEQLVNTLIDEAVDLIETTARDRLKAALVPPPIAKAIAPVKSIARKAKRGGSRKKAKAAKSATAPRVAARNSGSQLVPSSSEPKKRAKMRCGNCGAIGYRSDGCGKTHNVAGSPMLDAIERAKAIASAPTARQSSVLERARARQGAAG